MSFQYKVSPAVENGTVTSAADSEPLKPASKGCLAATGGWLRDPDNLLLVLTLIGVLLGAGLGFGLRLVDLSDEAVMLVSFPGELLMNMLKCVITPMIIASIVSSLVQLDISTSGRMGVTLALYYLTTTTLAVTTSLIVVMVVRPGDFAAKEMDKNMVGNMSDIQTGQTMQTLDMMLDFLRHLIPDNIFKALIAEVETQYVYEFDPYTNESSVDRVLVYTDQPNILGIVSFCIAFGLSVAAVPQHSAPVARLFTALNEVIIKMVTTLMWALPLGVIFLIAGSILELDANLADLIAIMGVFVATVFLALTIHFYLVLPLLYFVNTRHNPYKFLWHQGPAYINTLGHSSSSAALPVTCACLSEGNKCDLRVGEFCLPVGAAINVDGAALYEGLATVFIAQMHRMPLDWGRALAIILTVTLSSVGSSGLPGAGLVSVLPLIAPIPVTNADVAMLIVTDWLVDRYRTANNVMGDSMGAGIINHYFRAKLTANDQQQQQSRRQTQQDEEKMTPM